VTHSSSTSDVSDARFWEMNNTISCLILSLSDCRAVRFLRDERNELVSEIEADKRRSYDGRSNLPSRVDLSCRKIESLANGLKDTPSERLIAN